MTEDMAERVVVSVARLREAATELMAAAGAEWALAGPGTVAEARADGAMDALEALCREVGAGEAEVLEDGTVRWSW